jgi:hypothetical protein
VAFMVRADVADLPKVAEAISAVFVDLEFAFAKDEDKLVNSS